MIAIIKNNIKKIILSILILTMVTGGFLYYTYQQNLKTIESVTWEYWKIGDERRGSLVIYYTIQDNRQREYLLFDFWNLTTQVVYRIETEDYGRNPKIRFETFYLKRTGINSFEVEESIISSSTDFTFEEAVQIAKKYDVYKNNPYPDKITNYPQLNLTPKEIEENRQKQLEAERIETENQAFIANFNTSTIEERIKILEDENLELNSKYNDQYSEYYKSDLIKKSIQINNCYIDRLKSGEDIIFGNQSDEKCNLFDSKDQDDNYDDAAGVEDPVN